MGERKRGWENKKKRSRLKNWGVSTRKSVGPRSIQRKADGEGTAET